MVYGYFSLALNSVESVDRRTGILLMQHHWSAIIPRSLGSAGAITGASFQHVFIPHHGIYS